MPEFHIHVDASWVSAEFERLLITLGLRRVDFSREDASDGLYAPAHHMTIKIYDFQELRSTFDSIESYVSSHQAMIGYIEGEMLPFDLSIAQKPFDDSVDIPFVVELGNLGAGEFRETELHVTLDQQGTDPRLISGLRAMGLFCAHMPKRSGMALIFTVQGSRSHIDSLTPVLKEYLTAAGGACRASIKEERIVRWWISSADVKRPPVIKAIHWSKSVHSISREMA
jgi:hypothetical protein